MNFYFDPQRVQALLENTEALRRALAQPGRRVIVNIDELHEMIAASARACFSVHEHIIAHDPTSPDDATLPRELRRRAPAPARLTGAAQEMAFRELGRNIAGMIALGGEPVDDPRTEDDVDAHDCDDPDCQRCCHIDEPSIICWRCHSTAYQFSAANRLCTSCMSVVDGMLREP